MHTLNSQIDLSKEADSLHAMILANSVIVTLRVDIVMLLLGGL
jgi:hypothetical protein